jgi:CheY-like chemotaxis protein
VTLPISGDHSPVTPAPPAAILSEAVLSGLDILVVDDEPDSRELMGRVLAESKATVRFAANAEEALAELERNPPQVMVSDIGMPGKDGYELIRAVRARTAADAMPAIAVTAFARADDRNRALREGFQQHIAKPINPTTLVLTIASLTGRSNLASSGTLS